MTRGPVVTLLPYLGGAGRPIAKFRYPMGGTGRSRNLQVEVVFAVLERSFSRYEGRFRGKRPGISCLEIFLEGRFRGKRT